MSTLDDKLITLLKEIEYAGKYGEVHTATYEEIANKIKAAFDDEGYVKPLFTNVSVQELKADRNYQEQLTGAEWLSRFEKEYNAILSDIDPYYADDTLQAAKRASGITS